MTSLRDRVKIEIKICGLTNRDDAEAALDLGVDYVGFVLHPLSPRSISARRLGALLGTLRSGAKAVGVFVNESRADIERLCREGGMHAVQVHGGREKAGDFGVFPRPVWRAVSLRAGAWRPSPATWPAARYVADAAAPGRYGGSGKTTDWGQAAKLAERYPVMLAGGLTPENVAEAVRKVRPLGVDVASGVEAAPGKKDRAKMKRFVEAARQAAAGISETR